MQGGTMEWRKARATARSQGVTLIETMATVAIVAIVGSVAIPSFVSLHGAANRTAIVNDFVLSIFLARSEAIKRNSLVSLCLSTDGNRCDNDAPNWNGGL